MKRQKYHDTILVNSASHGYGAAIFFQEVLSYFNIKILVIHVT
jgi:hypothetical protein